MAPKVVKVTVIYATFPAINFPSCVEFPPTFDLQSSRFPTSKTPEDRFLQIDGANFKVLARARVVQDPRLNVLGRDREITAVKHWLELFSRLQDLQESETLYSDRSWPWST